MWNYLVLNIKAHFIYWWRKYKDTLKSIVIALTIPIWLPLFCAILIVTYPIITIYDTIVECDEKWCSEHSRWCNEHKYAYYDYGTHVRHSTVKKLKRQYRKEKKAKNIANIKQELQEKAQTK